MRDSNIRQVADGKQYSTKPWRRTGYPMCLPCNPCSATARRRVPRSKMEIEKETGMIKVGFFDAKGDYDHHLKQVRQMRGDGLRRGRPERVIRPGYGLGVHGLRHLTNGANYLMAKELTNLVRQRIRLMPLSPDDKMSAPIDSYLKDYSTSAKVSSWGKPADVGQHILKGYPGPELLEVASNPKAAGPVVVDFGSVQPVSRLRIVWGDEKSVPSAWKVELSEDGKTWNAWLNVAKTVTDKFDQWPGFEDHATGSKQARYARYIPEGDSAKNPIRLRQLSLFR